MARSNKRPDGRGTGVFGEPNCHEVSARVAAIDWRCQALARLSGPVGAQGLVATKAGWWRQDRADRSEGSRDGASDRDRRRAGFGQ
jgi:hypothetical protein